MTDAPPAEQPADGGARRRPRWQWVVAGVAAVILAGVAGGAIVAATRSDSKATSIGCVARSVANRGLPYDAELKASFASVETLADNNKFRVSLAVR